MKKVFILLTALLSVGVINASINYVKPQNVLVAAELVGFEVEEEQKNISEGNTINTSLKKLGVVTYINPENNKFVACFTWLDEVHIWMGLRYMRENNDEQ